jgi:hypothetical protein
MANPTFWLARFGQWDRSPILSFLGKKSTASRMQTPCAAGPPCTPHKYFQRSMAQTHMAPSLFRLRRLQRYQASARSTQPLALGAKGMQRPTDSTGRKVKLIYWRPHLIINLFLSLLLPSVIPSHNQSFLYCWLLSYCTFMAASSSSGGTTIVWLPAEWLSTATSIMKDVCTKCLPSIR